MKLGGFEILDAGHAVLALVGEWSIQPRTQL